MRTKIKDQAFPSLTAFPGSICYKKAFLFACFSLLSTCLWAIPPERVLILANSDLDQSVALAEFYSEARNIPAENIIALPMSDEETISISRYVRTILEPLRDELLAGNWLEGTLSEERDRYHRRNITVTGRNFDLIVVCKGVPLRMANRLAFYEEEELEKVNPNFRFNRAAVDSQLALLHRSDFQFIGPFQNPLFNNQRPTGEQRSEIILVGRIDGPTYTIVRERIQDAIKVETQTGLRGRAYIDLKGPQPLGEEWLATTGELTQQLGFDTHIHREDGIIPTGDRFDAPALYFGWYSQHVGGVWNDEGVRAVPGAIGFHIHSFSATTVSSRDLNWSGPLLSRGVAATVGNVYEPYLQLSHHPHLFLLALVNGATLAEASAFSVPAYSWQAISLGDPLYRPFAFPPNQQIPNLLQNPDEYDQYLIMVLLRRAAQNERSQLLELATQYIEQFPRSWALQIFLATQGRNLGWDESPWREKVRNSFDSQRDEIPFGMQRDMRIQSY